MTGKRKLWRQINIQGVLVLTLVAATFAAGYRSGSEQSDEFMFQELTALIKGTLIKGTLDPDTWEALGGPGAMAPFPQNLSTGCFAEVVDHMAPNEDAELSLVADETTIVANEVEMESGGDE